MKLIKIDNGIEGNILRNEGNENVIFLITNKDMISKTDFLKKLDCDKKYDYVEIYVDDWDTYLTPWPVENCLKNRIFSGEAIKLLKGIEKIIIPRLNENSTVNRKIYFAGYSLAGLFALWSLYESENFENLNLRGAVCCSGSLWYPNWTDYISKKYLLQDSLVYLSLGKKEPETRNPVMSQVGNAMETQFKLLQENLGDEKCFFEWNDGGHFSNPDERMLKGLKWLLENESKINNKSKSINLKMIIAYDGSRYNGWQKQGNTENTLQQKIENTFSQYFLQEVEVAASGRTDAGVNANGQVINFKVNLNNLESDLIKIQSELNSYLPSDIRILKIEKEDIRFHARLNAKSKMYSYRIDNGSVQRIFDRKYVYRVEEKLNLELMKKASEKLIGEHDFFGFQANKKMKKSTVRNIYNITIKESEGLITIEFFCNGFLYNMVRIITGTLIEIGLGKRKIESIDEIFISRDRSRAGYLVPGNALFLEKVYY